METKLEFYKAIRLLDCGKMERAMEILQEVIKTSQEEKDDLSFIRSNCVLGELYFGLNDFDKSRFHLEAALNTMNNCNLEKDLFDYEKLSASKILMKLSKY